MLGRKIYIASPIKNSILNKKIVRIIENETDFSVFLPETLNLQDSIETIDLIASKCYREIDTSDIILIIFPYGLSTAAEIGYSICLRRNGKEVKIIMLNQNKFELKIEAAINPFIDKIFYSAKDIIDFLNESH